MENSINKKKTLSIIIPVYNDPEGIRQTLDSLLEQDYPREKYEILVVDNNSTDQTPETIKKYEQEHPGLIKKLEETMQSSYAARNKGIKKAKGKTLAFLDADETVEKNYLSKIIEKLEKNPDIKCMGCEIEIYAGEKTAAGIYNQTTGFPAKKYITKDNFVPTGCMVIKPEIFEKIGGFNQELISGGDREFGNRATKAGIELHYFPDIKVYHPARTTISSLLKKYYRIGIGRSQISQLKTTIDTERPPLIQRLKKFTQKKEWEKLSRTTRIQMYLIKLLCFLAFRAGIARHKHFGKKQEQFKNNEKPETRKRNNTHV